MRVLSLRRLWAPGTRTDTAAFGGMAVATIVAGVYLLHKGSDLTFFYDEWSFVTERHAWTADAFLTPHNGHFVLVPVVIYKLLFAVAGLDHYWAYRLVGVLTHVLCSVLLFLLLRRRVGAPLGALGALMLLFLGASAQNILWPFQLTFLCSIAAGFGALLLLDRGTRRADVIACVLLVLSVAGGEIGLCLVAGVIVELALDPRRRERWWIVVVPLVVYALWWLGYHSGSDLTASNISHAPMFVADEAAAAASGLIAQDLGWGRPVALAVAAFVVWRITRPVGPTRRAAMLVSAVLVFWILVALARAQYDDPGASRYIYPGAALVLLVVGEMLPRSPPRPSLLAVSAVAAVGSAIGGLPAFDGQAKILRNSTDTVRPGLTAVELARRTVAYDFKPDVTSAPGLFAGPYLAAIKDIGSTPALSVAQLQVAPEPQREAADSFLVAALRLAPAAATGRVVGCGPASPDTLVPAGGFVVRTRGSAASLSLRRFGTQFSKPFASLPPSSTALIAIPRDDSSQPWHVSVTGAGPQVCPAA